MTAPSRPWTADELHRRRAVEALRSGVPSRHSVTELGTGQGEIEDRFTDLLGRADQPGDTAAASLLIGGGFGAGKSHLLTHLAHLAGQEGFVVSTVVISKETPLHDPAKVLRAAVESATGPGQLRDVVAEAAAGLDPDSPRHAEFLRWLRSAGEELNERFAATVFLHERLTGGEVPGADEEFADTIVRFWSGDPLPLTGLRRALRAAGAGRAYSFAPIKAAELARQRLRFLARLLRAAGHAGWVVLFDEVELIGRYALISRARSYAELARWMGGDPADPAAPVVAVLAMTDDFEAAVLASSGKNDREQLPERLRGKQREDYDELAAGALTGMRHVERDLVRLVPPDQGDIDAAYRACKALHGKAFGWRPPDVAGLERLGATVMRQYVRAWINEWDLLRADPTYQPATEIRTTPSDYRTSQEADESEGPDGLAP